MDQWSWQEMITALTVQRPMPLTAVQFQRLPEKGRSRNALMRCSDGFDYLVKMPPDGCTGREAFRPLVNDQIVGHLAAALGAPVAGVALVNVPRALVASSPDLAHVEPGVYHGSRWIPDSRTSVKVELANLEVNRARFALIALLYGWCPPQDVRQFLYERDTPHRVWVFDHGHTFFVPGKQHWTVESLEDSQWEAVEPDLMIRHEADLKRDELHTAYVKVEAVGSPAIAEAVAAPPDQWFISPEERVAMAVCLDKRREALLSACPS